ncbi:MAG: methyltransferase family protein [Candidatus Hodarchaeota archaeon]
MGKFQQLQGIFLLVLWTMIIPAIILLVTRDISIGWNLNFPINLILIFIGCCSACFGFWLMIRTSLLLVNIGKGTTSPFAPPEILVVTDIYQYVRNPMMIGVLFTVLGEIIIFGSLFLFGYLLICFVILHIAFLIYEEPELIKRFEDDYRLYKKNVPRWIPRLKPWTELSKKRPSTKEKD